MENLAFHSLLRYERWLYYQFLLPHSYIFSSRGCESVLFELRGERVNPFTPESDQCQNSPAASQEIWHHTVWRTWLFIAYSDEKWLYYKFSLHHSYNRFLKGWENTLFELRGERVKECSPLTVLNTGCNWHSMLWNCDRALSRHSGEQYRARQQSGHLGKKTRKKKHDTTFLM